MDLEKLSSDSESCSFEEDTFVFGVFSFGVYAGVKTLNYFLGLNYDLLYDLGKSLAYYFN